MLGEPENQFSLTRAASSTCGRAKSNFPVVFLSRVCHSATLRLAAVTLVAVACRSLAFGGQIHAEVPKGELERVKALRPGSPDLVRSTGANGWTLLHTAAAKGYKDVAKLLLASKADV